MTIRPCSTPYMVHIVNSAWVSIWMYHENTCLRWPILRLLTEQGWVPSFQAYCFHLLCAEAPLGCSKLEALPQKIDTDNQDRYFTRRDLLCHVMPTTCIFGLPCTPAMFLSHGLCSLDVALVREWEHYSKVGSFLGHHRCSQNMMKCLMETCE